MLILQTIEEHEQPAIGNSEVPKLADAGIWQKWGMMLAFLQRPKYFRISIDTAAQKLSQRLLMDGKA